MSARGLLTQNKLWFNPRRPLLPLLCLPNPLGPQRIRMPLIRNASAQNAPANVDSVSAANTVSSHSNDVHIREDGDTIQTDPHDAPASGTSYSERVRTHQFDTYRLVLALQSAGYSRPQAVALMKCLRTVLVNGTEFAKSHYLFRGDLENVTYRR